MGESDKEEDVELFDVAEEEFEEEEEEWNGGGVLHGPERLLGETLICCYREWIPSVLPVPVFWGGRSGTGMDFGVPERELEAGGI